MRGLSERPACHLNTAAKGFSESSSVLQSCEVDLQPNIISFHAISEGGGLNPTILQPLFQLGKALSNVRAVQMHLCRVPHSWCTALGRAHREASLTAFFADS